MNSSKLMKLATAGLGLALILGGCGSSTSTPGGSGGSSSSGGSTGSGGTSSSGGTTGSGGSSSGGSTGSGGASSGGTTGSGGAAGGAVGSGGKGGGSTGSGGKAGGSGSGSGGTSGGGSSGSMTLTSPMQVDGAKFDTKYTCAESPPATGQMTGQLRNGINPELDWSGAPAGTMSFAITFLDMTLINANMASLGNHWAIWNIPATVMKFPEGTMTLSGDLMNAKQSGAFLAPCAQSVMGGMDDQYEFTVYALSTATLNVSGTSVANARTALMSAMTAGQVLGTATLKGHAGLKGM